MPLTPAQLVYHNVRWLGEQRLSDLRAALHGQTSTPDLVPGAALSGQQSTPVSRCCAVRPAVLVCVQVLLKPSLEDLQQRVAARAARGGHFMPISLLRSQLEALEPDASALEFGSP